MLDPELLDPYKKDVFRIRTSRKSRKNPVLQPEAKKVKKAYQLSPEWDKLIKKDTANKNLWDQVKEIEVFTRKEFLDKVNKLLN
jgi:hypothetical protein